MKPRTQASAYGRDSSCLSENRSSGLLLYIPRLLPEFPTKCRARFSRIDTLVGRPPSLGPAASSPSRLSFLLVRMEVDPPEWFSKCPCGKSFYQPNSYSNHVKSCSRYKQNAGNVLDNAKARYAKKEKRRKGKEAVAVWYGEGGAALDVDQDLVMAEPPEPEAQVSHIRTFSSIPAHLYSPYRIIFQLSPCQRDVA